jgi:hypothetical protein
LVEVDRQSIVALQTSTNYTSKQRMKNRKLPVQF